MVFQPFQELLPEIAENETRSIEILQNQPGLPPVGNYMFIELFCADHDCDCRNVMITVFHVEKERQVATNKKSCIKKESVISFNFKERSVSLKMPNRQEGRFFNLGYLLF